MKYLSLVNIKMGSGSTKRYSNGNTLPLCQRPFGMAAFCPQTDSERGNWFFDPYQPYIEGIRLTHQPSPWVGDFGAFLMMPQNDVISDSAKSAWSGYRISDAVMQPHYTKIDLLRSNCRFELTPTERCAAIRLSFGDSRPSALSFLPVEGNYSYSFDESTSTLFGSCDYVNMGIAVDFKCYIAVRFPKGSVASVKINDHGKDTAAHIFFNTQSIEAYIGSSYISYETALAAIERECTSRSFSELCSLAEEAWEEKLCRIEITAESKEQLRTFYSCLYRTFLYPSKAYELDECGNAVHYSPIDGVVRSGVRYTNNGFWDTSRTVYPLFALIAKEEFAEMLEGFVNDYKESGWLPRWLSIGELGCMPSTLIDSVIACAAVNKIGSREVLETALEGMLKHANTEAKDKRFGRNGATSYLKYGYVPRNQQRESVNLTQDAAYGDYCIAVVARELGREELVEEYLQRSKNYKNIFDPSTGFMRGRDTEGNMAEGFDPCTWGGEYTEGSAWQNSFFVPHDTEGLAELYGGKDKLLIKLDELFSTPPRYRVFGYGFEIHEMTEMAAVDFGQCAVSNQPSFHIPFIYAALGEVKKTEHWVHKMISELFSATEDGYPGDEDNGSMSAWYIMSSLGFYPYDPAKRELIRFTPAVSSAKLMGKKII